MGSEEAIQKARRVRKMLGGGMRQIGILAAAALYALENHIDRLAEDHQAAVRLAEGLSGIEGIKITNQPIESNIVFFEISPEWGNAESFSNRLKAFDILIGISGEQRLRGVTHLDVSSPEMPSQVVRAIEKMGPRT